jgi:hypothetical protein
VNFLRRLALQEKEFYDSSRLDVVEIARVAWHASFQPLWQENTCNSAHEQTPLSNDTIDCVLRHREVSWAVDFSATPRKIVPVTDYSDWEIFLLSSVIQANSRTVQIQILSSLLFVMYSHILIAVFSKT